MTDIFEGIDRVLILDFGSQYSHIIVRRTREIGIYCELQPCDMKFDDMKAYNPKGVILSGGPSSIYEEDSPALPEGFFEWVTSQNIPVLGICYGFQASVSKLGGKVEQSGKGEYGHAILNILNKDALMFQGIEETETQIWASHRDKVTGLPEGWTHTASSVNCEFSAAENHEKKLYGLQFHPEVFHTVKGKVMLENFLLTACACQKNWKMDDFCEVELRKLRETVADDEHVIGAVSGGVDSTVAAVLLAKALGDRFHAIMVDHGLLRKDEAKSVKARMEGLGVNLTVVDASELFLGKLAGVEDPEQKRKIIGFTFIEVFEAEAKKIPNTKFLLQGTLYPDVIESVSFKKGPSATIKSHHNLTLPEKLDLKLIEPMRELFKDEVRALGRILGIEEKSIMRHPFPGPGLAIRILGSVDPASCDILREVDSIYLEELHKNNIYGEISQAFSVLLPVKSVGVMGDSRTYEQVVVLRAVKTTDFMTADWYHMPYDVIAKISNRIINEVRGVNRVCYDVSSKPPATIEWE